jgi:hypothetical protein
MPGGWKMGATLSRSFTCLCISILVNRAIGEELLTLAACMSVKNCSQKPSKVIGLCQHARWLKTNGAPLSRTFTCLSKSILINWAIGEKLLTLATCMSVNNCSQKPSEVIGLCLHARWLKTNGAPLSCCFMCLSISILVNRAIGKKLLTLAACMSVKNCSLKPSEVLFCASMCGKFKNTNAAFLETCVSIESGLTSLGSNLQH